VDDALAVTNLVYVGTVVIGGLLVAFLAVATFITLIIAGAGQGVASLVTRVVRLLKREQRPADAVADARAEHARQAIVAKADAILAAQRAAAEAAAARPTPAVQPAPATKPARPEQPASAEKPAADQPAKAPASKPTVVVVRALPATTAHRPGPHTGTQPVLVVGRAS
jgi:hypothetical protein